MAAKGSAEYERGLRNGKTDVSMEGLASGIDEIKAALLRLPCVRHYGDLRALKLGQWINRTMLLLAISGLGGLTYWVLEHMAE